MFFIRQHWTVRGVDSCLVVFAGEATLTSPTTMVAPLRLAKDWKVESADFILRFEYHADLLRKDDHLRTARSKLLSSGRIEIE